MFYFQPDHVSNGYKLKNVKFESLKGIWKIVPVVLLAVLLAATARYFVFTSIVKFHKQEFRQLILQQERNEVKQVFISTEKMYLDVDGLEWKENNKELVIKNKYHEVLSVEMTQNGYLVNIIADDLENELFSNFNKAGDQGKKLADYLLFVFAFNGVFTHPADLKAPASQLLAYSPITGPPGHSGFISETIKPPAVSFYQV